MSKSAPGRVGVKNSDPNCGTVTLGIVKQVAPTVASAVTNWLKGVLTVANIDKCLSCTSKKLDDDFDRDKQPRCGSAPSGEQGAPIQNPHTGAPGHWHSGTARLSDPRRPSQSFVDYPAKFSGSVKAEPVHTTPINWNLAEKSSVLKRWQSEP